MSADIDQYKAGPLNRNPPLESVQLGTHSARGLVYLFAGTTVAKVVSFVTQLILLYLLGRNDFGVVSLAYTITDFHPGDRAGRRGRRARTPAGLSTMGDPRFLAGARVGRVELLVDCPAHQWQRRFTGRMPYSAISCFGCYWCSLRRRFRMRCRSCRRAIIPGVAIPGVGCDQSGEYHAAKGAHRGVRGARFRALQLCDTDADCRRIDGGIFMVVGPSAIWAASQTSPLAISGRRLDAVVYAEFGRALLDQSDYMLLGVFRTFAAVGVYTVGFMFSVQMLQLLTANMTYMLFPAFTKLNNQPQKQLDGFLRAQRILSMVGVSGCLLQAAIAAPFLRFAFPARWEPSIVVMQILSLGMATRMIGGASFALLKSQGRFTTTCDLSMGIRSDSDCRAGCGFGDGWGNRVGGGRRFGRRQPDRSVVVPFRDSALRHWVERGVSNSVSTSCLQRASRGDRLANRPVDGGPRFRPAFSIHRNGGRRRGAQCPVGVAVDAAGVGRFLAPRAADATATGGGVKRPWISARRGFLAAWNGENRRPRFVEIRLQSAPHLNCFRPSVCHCLRRTIALVQHQHCSLLSNQYAWRQAVPPPDIKRPALAASSGTP